MTTASTAIVQQIKDQYRQLRLPIVAQQVLVQSEQVARTGGSGLDLLQVLLGAELQERAKNRARRRIHEAHFPLQKVPKMRKNCQNVSEKRTRSSPA